MLVEEKISIRVSSRIKMLVQEIADKTNTSKSLVIRVLIERSLNEIEDAGLILPLSNNDQSV